MTIFAYPSLRSLYIEPHRDGVCLSSATGFVVDTVAGPHLITNLHVVTGRHLVTCKVNAIPDELVIYHHKKGCLGEWVARSEPLVSDNWHLWREHPRLGDKADFVALPLTNLEAVDLYYVDPLHPWHAEHRGDKNGDLLLRPSDMVSVVGFPFGKSSSGYAPIWVTGFLASELSECYQGLPVHLIDSRTRPGQSGSPVFVYRSGGAVPTKPGAVTVFNGPVTKFLGVYSGRINKDSDLGMVWKASALAELIKSIGN